MYSPLAKTETGSPREPMGNASPKADTEMVSHKKACGNSVVKSSSVLASAQKFQSIPTVSLCNGDLSLRVGVPSGNGTPGDKG